ACHARSDRQRASDLYDMARRLLRTGGSSVQARWIPAPPSSVPPKLLESVRRHFGVSDGVLDVLVAKVVLQGPRVVAIIGQLEPAGMAKHVRVDGECHLGGLPDTLDEAMEADGADRPTAFGNEHVSLFRVIAA